MRRQVRDRVVELVRVRAGDLLEHPQNWRRHAERQRSVLRGVLAEIGYADAVIARPTPEGLQLIDGHLRRGLNSDQMLPVLVVDLDEQEARTLLATLDPIAALAGIDAPALEGLLGSVQTSSAAVRSLLDDLRRAARLPVLHVTADPDVVPPVPSEPVTRLGDVWILGPHRVVCGDATSADVWAKLLDGEQASAMWTDPPYGVDYVGKTVDKLTLLGDRPTGLDELLRRSFTNANAHLEPGAPIYVAEPSGALQSVFLAAFFEQGWRMHQSLVWVKDRPVLGRSDYHFRHEQILFGYARGGGRRGRGRAGWYGGNAQDSVLEVARPAASREHPTMKPVELIVRCLLNSSAEGDVVLDPFGGSGSTLVACHLHGRRARLLEVDPRYCDVIIRRYEAISGQTAKRETPGRRQAG
jgi:DNA modification methylase